MVVKLPREKSSNVLFTKSVRHKTSFKHIVLLLKTTLRLCCFYFPANLKPQISILLSASCQIIICCYIRRAGHLHTYEAGVREILGWQSASSRYWEIIIFKICLGAGVGNTADTPNPPRVLPL